MDEQRGPAPSPSNRPFSARDSLACQALAESNLRRPYRHRYLEGALCQVGGDHRSLTHGILVSREQALMTPTTVARKMPIETREESISSFQRATGLAFGHPCRR